MEEQLDRKLIDNNMKNVSKYCKLCNLLASILSYSNFASHLYKVLTVISNLVEGAGYEAQETSKRQVIV